jgi:outer membrane protein TolC
MKLYQESFLAQAEEALKVAEANYSANLTDFLTLLDAQRTLRETRLDYYKAIVDYLQNLASLERAVGANL